MRKLWIAALVLAAAFSLTTCGGGDIIGPDGDSSNINVARWASMTGRWIYQPVGGGPQIAFEIIGQDRLNGILCNLRLALDSAGNPTFLTYWGTDMSDGLYAVGFREDYQTINEDEYVYSPPVPYLLANFVHGRTYSNTIDVFLNGQIWVSNGTWRITIVPETVVTPAGTFDCYRATTELDGGSGRSFQEVTWFAHDVGIVRFTDAGGFSYELVSYTP
jgi:hypothetical protein